MRGFPNNGAGALGQELRARDLEQVLRDGVLGRGFRVRVLGTKVYGSVVLV